MILEPRADAPDFLRDPARLAALQEAGLLDAQGGVTGGEAFDGLTRTAARLLAVPLACVTLLTDERQLVASAAGPDAAAHAGATDAACECFCRYVVGQGDRFIVDDATRHPAMQDSSAVRAGRIGAYAGVPLTTREGHVLGTFCVVDRMPREWTAAELEVLTDLADAAAAKLQLTRASCSASSRSPSRRRGCAPRSRRGASPSCSSSTRRSSTRSAASRAGSRTTSTTCWR